MCAGVVVGLALWLAEKVGSSEFSAPPRVCLGH